MAQQKPTKRTDWRLSLADCDEMGKLKAKLREDFDSIDTDKSGKICKKEIEKAKILQMELGLSDVDDDGLVSFDELWNLMKNAYYPDIKSAEDTMASRVGEERLASEALRLAGQG